MQVSWSGSGRTRRAEYSRPMNVTSSVSSQTAPIELTNHSAAVVTGSMLCVVEKTRRVASSASMSGNRACGRKSSRSTAKPIAV